MTGFRAQGPWVVAKSGYWWLEKQLGGKLSRLLAGWCRGGGGGWTAAVGVVLVPKHPWLAGRCGRAATGGREVTARTSGPKSCRTDGIVAEGYRCGCACLGWVGGWVGVTSSTRLPTHPHRKTFPPASHAIYKMGGSLTPLTHPPIGPEPTNLGPPTPLCPPTPVGLS